MERHYGHLSDRYLREEVNRFAPALGHKAQAGDSERTEPRSAIFAGKRP